MKKRILLVVLLSGLLNLTAQAGNRAGAYTFTLGSAYDFWSAKRDLHNTWVLPTAAIAYNLTENWAIEGAWGSFQTSQNSSIGGGSVNGDLYTIDGLYRFNNFYHFEPYVSAGVGVYHINPNGSNAQNQGNINAGLGTQLFFDKSVALRGEVRNIYTWVGSKNDVSLGFGVSFLFGGNESNLVYKDKPE